MSWPRRSLGEVDDRRHGDRRIVAVSEADPGHCPVPFAVEITLDYGLADVVADRFDAGVRLGGEIARDMIAVRIGPDIPMAILGSPDYFRRHPPPTSAAQLVDHRAINLRLPTSGTLNGWRRPGNPRPGRGPAGPDQHRPDPRCGIGRPRPGLSAAGPGSAGSGRRPPAARPGPADTRPAGLSPVLSPPPPCLVGLHPAGRNPALARVMAYRRPESRTPDDPGPCRCHRQQARHGP